MIVTVFLVWVSSSFKYVFLLLTISQSGSCSFFYLLILPTNESLMEIDVTSFIFPISSTKPVQGYREVEPIPVTG